MPPSVDLVVSGPIARITLNHPSRRNSLTAEMVEQFLQHLEAIENNADVRVLVLGGADGKAFCAGVSLEQLPRLALDPRFFEALTGRLSALSIPKIAAMNGGAWGGGVELGLCCDLRIGVPGMVIRVPAAELGLCYPVAGIRRFVSALGLAQAKRILVTADTISAPELLGMGYLHRIVAADDLPLDVEREAERLSALAPQATSTMLRICEQVADGTLNEEQARRRVERCNESPELAKRLDAFLQRLHPD